MQDGIEENLEKIQDIYKYDIELHIIYAKFHGIIVEYAKRFIRGKHVDTQAMEGET